MYKMSKLALLGFIAVASLSANGDKHQALVVYQGMQDKQLAYNGKEFGILSGDGNIRKIERGYIDKPLRGIKPEQLQKLLLTGAYLKATKFNDSDECSLKLCGRLQGGGPVGVGIGVVGGKAATYAGAYTAYTGIATVSNFIFPGSYPIVWGAMEKTLAVPLEAASQKAAVAGGIFMGTFFPL